MGWSFVQMVGLGAKEREVLFGRTFPITVSFKPKSSRSIYWKIVKYFLCRQKSFLSLFLTTSSSLTQYSHLTFPHACRRERTSLDLGVPAVTSLLMPVWGPGLVSHAGRGDGAAVLRPWHCAVNGSGCVSPCISSTALAPFSSAELRQWGVIAHVPPPHFFNEHSSHQLGCQGEWGRGWSASFSYRNLCLDLGCLLLSSSGTWVWEGWFTVLVSVAASSQGQRHVCRRKGWAQFMEAGCCFLLLRYD